MSVQEPEQTPLETHLPMPRGGVAPRCQRRKKDGSQCGKPARSGYKICSTHGAGYPSREAAGDRRKPGRPVTTGVYSVEPKRTFAETQAEVAQLEDALTSSDRDLIALKSALVLRLGQLEDHGPAVEAMEAELERLMAEAARMEADSISPEQAMRFASRLAALRQPAAWLIKLTTEIADVSVKSVTANKTRAETRAKLSEVEGLHYFLQLLAVARKIVHELAPDDNVRESYELALKREIFLPNHLEVPNITLQLEGLE